MSAGAEANGFDSIEISVPLCGRRPRISAVRDGGGSRSRTERHRLAVPLRVIMSWNRQPWQGRLLG
jgi:hypothetical protein